MSPKKVQGTKTELSCGTEYNYCAFEGLRGERDMKLLRLLAMLMLGFNFLCTTSTAAAIFIGCMEIP